MTKVILNDFSGGIAEDVREIKTDTFAVAKNFDIKSFPNKIVPYVGTISQGQNSNTYSMGAAVYELSNGTKLLSFLGASDSGVYYPVFYGQNNTTIGGSLFGFTGGSPTTTGYKVGFGTLTIYKNKMICLAYSSTDAKMYSYDNATATFATVGIINTANAANFSYPANISAPFIPKPFRHPADDILYGAFGNCIIINNAGTATYWANLPTDCWVTSIAEWGSYLAIATAPKRPGARSRVFFWDRDTSKTTFSEIIDFGEGELRVLENINGALVGISISNSNFSVTPQIKMTVWAGGQPEVVKTISATTFASTSLEIFKAKVNNELYFAAKFPIQGTTINQLWVAGKNKKGNWYMSPDRYINGTSSITTINGFDFIGDYMWVGYDSGSFNRTYTSGSDSPVYTAATLDTLINPNMQVDDRQKVKELKSVSLTTSGGGTFTISYSVDGSAFVDIYSGSISANSTLEFVNEATGKPLKQGKEYQFRLATSTVATSSGCPDITAFTYTYETAKSFINP